MNVTRPIRICRDALPGYVPVITPEGRRIYANSEDYKALKESNLRESRAGSAAAFHLRESRLLDDQELVTLDDDWVQVSATVPDTAELRWWLLGFGDQVEILSPKALRNEFVATTQGLADTYLK